MNGQNSDKYKKSELNKRVCLWSVPRTVPVQKVRQVCLYHPVQSKQKIAIKIHQMQSKFKEMNKMLVIKNKLYSFSSFKFTRVYFLQKCVSIPNDY